MSEQDEDHPIACTCEAMQPKESCPHLHGECSGPCEHSEHDYGRNPSTGSFAPPMTREPESQEKWHHGYHEGVWLIYEGEETPLPLTAENLKGRRYFWANSKGSAEVGCRILNSLTTGKREAEQERDRAQDLNHRNIGRSASDYEKLSVEASEALTAAEARVTALEAALREIDALPTPEAIRLLAKSIAQKALKEAPSE